jgi:hypothetical protein
MLVIAQVVVIGPSSAGSQRSAERPSSIALSLTMGHRNTIRPFIALLPADSNHRNAFASASIRNQHLIKLSYFLGRSQ